MRTKREPGFARNANRDSTRGVRILPERAGRPKPFGVQWSERVWDDAKGREVRKVKTQFFDNETDRDRRAATLRDARRAGALQTMNRREVDEWRAFRAAIGSTPWPEVVNGWRAHLQAAGVLPSGKTVASFATEWLADLKAAVDRSEFSLGTYRHHKQKVGLFVGQFGHMRLNEPRTEDVAAWLKSLNLEAAGTYNNYRKSVSAFFAAAVKAKHRGDNPCKTIDERADGGEEVGILTVPQLAQLFHTAQTFEDGRGEKRFAIALRRLALEAFAGVRYSSACRLTAEDVNIEDKGIRHTARSIKTRKRQYIEGYPELLWDWLRIAPLDTNLTERQYLKLKSDLFFEAGVPHPHNCLRHSFATYHLASRPNPGQTAYLLCHRNQNKLWDHYKGNAKASEGKRWEMLTPTAVAAMAREWTESPEFPAQQGQPGGDVPARVPDQPDTSSAHADG